MSIGRRAAAAVLLAAVTTGGPLFAQHTPLPTTLENFYMRGSQPDNPQSPTRQPIARAASCMNCHEVGAFVPIGQDWAGSLMAQAARDPVFYACLEIAETDAPGSGDACLRCHVPKAWLEGRSRPTNGSAVTRFDRDGVSCGFCHRLVDPFGKPGAPPVDPGILSALGSDVPIQSIDLLGRPGDSFGANYVLDPQDRRRGPFPIAAGPVPVPPEANCGPYHPNTSYESAFHRRADFCATCHDVSLPHLTRNGSSFVFNGANVRHPTGNKYDMVPVERTYSEWLHSAFAAAPGVNMGGRFGGPGQTYVSTCQDCHMPFGTASGCAYELERDDLPMHHFSGASTWVLDAIAIQYGPTGPPPTGGEIGLFEITAMQANKLRNINMLQRAATMQVSMEAPAPGAAERLKVRVVNETGHKLPSGYPEGRRVWVNAQFFDCTNYETPFAEYGHYDFDTAELITADTKVYEFEGGLDAAMAALTGLPPGPTMRFALTNAIFKDNRIPPRGFTNADYAAVGAPPVNYSYADGQYWDDTRFDVPGFAVGARVRLYYQASSKEYIEFLRDNNPNPGPGSAGQIAYDLWVQTGKGAPVLMAEAGDPVRIDVEVKGDLNGDRVCDLADLPLFVNVLIGLDTDPRRICAADMNGTGGPNGLDVPLFTARLLAP